jgi:DNA repair exonuclease SbcCD nuclease subunit
MVMHSFAHLSDVHIGAFGQPRLKRLVLDAFVKALDECIRRKVDFIIISGDLFDSNLPDMAMVEQAVKKMREVKDSGIEIYAVYGSHDFSPNQSSMVDVLESAGLFVKVTKGRMVNEKLVLDLHVDKKTGAKLAGISGRKSGTDREFFNVLDREALEKEKGFKVFLFHGAVTEYKSQALSAMDSMPLSNFPKGFDYYAGGHIHESSLGKVGGFDNVAYPGTLFGGDYRDLEKSARGQKRGFYIVSFSDKVERVDFVEVPACEYKILEYNADGKASSKAQAALQEMVTELDPAGKLVLIKVRGELSSGKTSEIEFSSLARSLEERGAIQVLMNHHQLTTKEYASIKVVGETTRDIETKVFSESIASLKLSNGKLKGGNGVKLSLALLDQLKHEKKDNEVTAEYKNRLVLEGVEILGINKEMEEA